ncbi:MAG: VWA domain-containing protein [Planctomycetota bacterium]|nr:VWA domain-containing protein [Planctomycetota bacterium]
MKSAPRNRRLRPKGAIAVLSAFALVIMVAMLAMALDVGFMSSVRTDMQTAADAGALAGAGELANGQQAAEVAARKYVMSNAETRPGVSDADIATNISVGHWDRGQRSFTKDQTPLNAVKVVADRNNAPLFFGNVLNQHAFNMQASAVATFQPRDIMLVLDYSGSMRVHNKIGALKDAVAAFIAVLQQSQSNDRVGFSVYSTEGRLAKSLTFDLPDLLRDVRSRSADGWTNMGQGMEKGRIELTNNARAGTKKLMVVMTDGMANRPTNRDPFQYVRDEADAAAAAGIPIVAISFSADSDQTIMQHIADTTQGVHYHVAGSVSQQEVELKRVFREVAAQRPLVLVD